MAPNRCRWKKLPANERPSRQITSGSRRRGTWGRVWGINGVVAYASDVRVSKHPASTRDASPPAGKMPTLQSTAEDRRPGSGTRHEDGGFDPGLLLVIRRELFRNGIDGFPFDQGHSATTKTAAGHAASVNPALLANAAGNIDKHVQFLATDFVIVAQRAMAGVHQLANGRPVRGFNSLSRVNRAFDFADDMARAAEGNVVHFAFRRFELVRGGVAQGGNT